MPENTTPEKAPRYWVLLEGCYPHRREEYVPATSRAHVQHLVTMHQLAGRGAWADVYAGVRTPWAEQDAYPDYRATRGVSNGHLWERA